MSEVSVDPSGGASQEYTEDCPVCCRPRKVRVTFDEWGDAQVAAATEDE